MPQDSPEHQITFANRHSAGPVVSSHAAGSRWPRTGRLLRRPADGYARDSRREDESAERAGGGD